jgi:hypothetical protein
MMVRQTRRDHKHIIDVIHKWTCIYAYKHPPGACTIKLFTAVIYGFSQLARVFVSGKPFQPSLMFVSEARSLP